MKLDNDIKKIKPQLPGGFRDYLPDEFARRQWILNRVATVYRSFGFKPMETSAIEYFRTLSGSGETSKQVYRIFNREPDFSGDSLALRFDLTVSLARIIAANRKSFTFPFKRYQIGEVWRGERQQKGRFKQFLQFDADIVGTADVSADAEIILIIARTMEALGTEKYKIKLNNRKILNGFIRSLGLNDEDINPFLRILDKLERIGWEGVKEILSQSRSNSAVGDEDRGLGLAETEIGKVSEFITLEPGNYTRINSLKKLLHNTPSALAGIDEIAKIITLSLSAGVAEERIAFEPSLARGLDYYTGPVFETILEEPADLGSVMSGGRYDNLVQKFCPDSIPATGISLGVDRLLLGLEELKLLKAEKTAVLALVVGLNEDLRGEVFALASKLRDASIPCELYLGDNLGLKKQIAYADKYKIPYCLIIGPEEKSKNTVQFKDLSSGIQKELTLQSIINLLKPLV